LTDNDAKPQGRRPYGVSFTIDAGNDPASSWIEVSGGELPCPVAVRLGLTRTGRPCFTGVRIGQALGGDDLPEVNSKTLRAVNLGSIMRYIREAVAARQEPWNYPVARPSSDGLTTIGALLLGTAEPTRLAVHRGPKGDPESDERTLLSYEAALAAGLTRTEAVAQVSTDMYVSVSQVYRRMARARRRREQKEGRQS